MEDWRFHTLESGGREPSTEGAHGRTSRNLSGTKDRGGKGESRGHGHPAICAVLSIGARFP